MSLFPDVPDNSPFADAIDFLATFGIMVGDEYGNFFPVYGLVVLQYFVSEQWKG